MEVSSTGWAWLEECVVKEYPPKGPNGRDRGLVLDHQILNRYPKSVGMRVGHGETLGQTREHRPLNFSKVPSINSYWVSTYYVVTIIVIWQLPSGFPDGSAGKNLPAMQDIQETQARSLGQEDPLEQEMTTHSSNLAWKTPWTEEPGGLQSKGSQRFGHN